MQHELKVSIGNLSVELSGSEDFVKKYEEKFQLVVNLEKAFAGTISNGLPSSKAELSDSQNTDKSPTNKYENVFDVGEENTKLILRKVPGKNKKAKQINVALLYLFGEYLRTRKAVGTAKELRKMLDEYACYNSSCTAGLRSQKGYFLFSGKKQNYQISLTKPGLDKAEKLAKDCNDE